MKEKPYYPVVYMFVITCICSLFLIGLARVTGRQINVNAQMAFERAVVGAFPKIDARTNAQVHQVFTQQFQFDEQTQSYRYIKDGTLAGYAVPFSGQGFWDIIEGVIGIEPDKTTVTGISFYRQTETPGLGARIDEKEFREQFAGLKINHTGNPIGIRMVARQLRENEIHAITGATQTSVRLETLLNDRLKQWLDSFNTQNPAKTEPTP